MARLSMAWSDVLLGQRGEKDAEVRSRQELAGKLYRVRSGLSHSGGTTFAPENVSNACALARFVIDAAIQYPDILDG
jgi:hypothetical protein